MRTTAPRPAEAAGRKGHALGAWDAFEGWADVRATLEVPP